MFNKRGFTKQFKQAKEIALIVVLVVNLNKPCEHPATWPTESASQIQQAECVPGTGSGGPICPTRQEQAECVPGTGSGGPICPARQEQAECVPGTGSGGPICPTRLDM